MFSLRNLAGKCFWKEMGFAIKAIFFFFFHFLCSSEQLSTTPCPLRFAGRSELKLQTNGRNVAGSRTHFKSRIP
jgi:hypothetical protein